MAAVVLLVLAAASWRFGIGTVLPFLADALPMLVAILGIIMSYKQPPRESHLVTTLTLITAGLVGTAILSESRIRSEAAHADDTRTVMQKLQSVGDQNTQILSKVLAAAAASTSDRSQDSIILRRQNILALLRNEYILSHDNVSAALMAGTEQPPSDWVNQRLRQLGETWSVASYPQVKPQQPPQIQIATSYGNLKERCTALATNVAALVRHRYDQEKKYPNYPRLSIDGLKEWYRSNDLEFRHLYLPQVKAVRDEFALLHIKDERLDEILNRDQEHIQLRQSYPQISPDIGYVTIFEMQDIAERLMALAAQIPQ